MFQMTFRSIIEEMDKTAKPDHPILDVMTRRWSPYAFDGRPVEEAKLHRIFEAARWAASSFNEQPWRFLTAATADRPAFEKLASVLAPANHWAENAPFLAMSVARTRFTHNGSPNRVAVHDVGQAAAHMALQAVAEGLVMHQMAGFDTARAREIYGIPAEFEPVAMIAIGYEGAHDRIPESLRERERRPRLRKPQPEFVFTGAWPHAF
jgi:nitroreductase